MEALKCECGKEIVSKKSKFCEDCRKQKRKEKSRQDAKRFREKHGSKVKRGVYCSSCKGIKEHQDRGYCLACERIRYLDRSKPNCSKCEKPKENIRDAYCNTCKREKTREKSFIEGRRLKNAKGRKSTCSNCGREKEINFLNESYCEKCKIFKKKLIRPYRTEEQKFKDAVRGVTARKIRQGILVRLPCEKCGTNEDVQAHHDDYYKPLDIRWLCRKHHREHHRLND